MIKKIETALKRILMRGLTCVFRRKTGHFDPSAVQRILIVRQDNRIGNLIFILPLTQMLRTRYPSALIGLVAGGSYPDLLSQGGLFDRVHCYDQLRFIRAPWRFVLFLREVRRMRYEVALDAKRAFSFNNFWLTLLSGAPVRIGFAHAEAAGYYTREAGTGDLVEYEAECLARLSGCFGIRGPVPEARLVLDPASREAARSILSASGLLQGEGLIGVHPGGRGRKRWPSENFEEVCRHLLAQTRARIAVFLGPEEKNVRLQENDRLKVLRPANASLLAALLACCRMVLCNDSGALHLAAAVKVPTVSLFLASLPQRYAPRGRCHTVFDGTAGRPLDPREVARAVLSGLHGEGG